MIKENKVSKYLLYAIGEIILVVIGILIALQINNWNQDRINKNLESKYYTRLLEDLKEEESGSHAFIEYLEQVSFHAKKAILLFENQLDLNENPTQDLIDLYQASQILDGRAIKSTYQELLSSGQLNIFQNDSIKSAIISYYDNNWSESLVFQLPDTYRENLRSKMPYKIQEKIRTSCGDTYKKVRKNLTVFLPKDCDIDFPNDVSIPVLENLLSDTTLKEDLLFFNRKSRKQIGIFKKCKKPAARAYVST